MSKREEIEQKTESYLAPIADENGVRIYDVEYVKEGQDYFLRCYIDKDGGVTIDDCENVSRALSDLLDREDYIAEAYVLEVSSPGLGRTLKKDRHLANSVGQEVELKTYKPIGKSKDFEGVLTAFDDMTVTVTLPDQTPQVFSRKDLAVIKLKLDF